MKRLMLILICIGTFSLSLSAQKYRTAVGVRLGNSFGLTAQQKVFKDLTIEGILQTSLGNQDHGRVTVLLEQHQKILGRRLNVYFGAGIHQGWLANRANEELDRRADSGITGVAGIEITLGRLNLSLDYKPIFNVFDGDRFYRGQSALSMRYVFVKAKKKKINWKFWKKRK